MQFIIFSDKNVKYATQKELKILKTICFVNQF